jgi:hypothetical protein
MAKPDIMSTTARPGMWCKHSHSFLFHPLGSTLACSSLASVCMCQNDTFARYSLDTAIFAMNTPVCLRATRCPAYSHALPKESVTDINGVGYRLLQSIWRCTTNLAHGVDESKSMWDAWNPSGVSRDSDWSSKTR